EEFGGDYTTVPLNIRFWNSLEENNDTVTVALDASGNYVAESWMNPAAVAGLSAKTPRNLRQRLAPTIPGDPLLYPTTNFLLLAGDATNDNNTDVFDLDVLVQNFNKADGDPGYLADADFNYDGFTDVFDLALLVQNFN